MMTLSRTIKPRLLTLVPLGRVTLGLACIHGVVGEDFLDVYLDSLTNTGDGLALPCSPAGGCGRPSDQQMLTAGGGLRRSR